MVSAAVYRSTHATGDAELPPLSTRDPRSEPRPSCFLGRVWLLRAGPGVRRRLRCLLAAFVLGEGLGSLGRLPLLLARLVLRTALDQLLLGV